MFEKVDNFLSGIGNGIVKGIDDLAEEAQKQKEYQQKEAGKVASKGKLSLEKRVQTLEDQMRSAMELIGMLQKQVMGGGFDVEPDEEEEVAA